MTVKISPDIKRESTRININGDEIDPKTKQVIKKNEPDFVMSKQQEKPKETKSALGDLIKSKINAKLEKLIEEKIDEALKDL